MVLISQMIRAMKKHKILAACMTCMLAAGGLFVTSCEDIEPIHELDLARVLSPTGLNVTISAKVNIEISWEALDEKAESYVLEVYKGETATEEALHTRAENLTTTSYRLENMGYEETYLIRVKAVGQDVEDSKWTEVVTKTDSEQIFSTVQSEDINGNSVTLRWPAGEAADQITITPVGAEDAEATITLTPDDVANGYVTVSGLEYETDYTAVMTLGNKTRGTITFKTGIDISKATIVSEGANLKEVLDGALEGQIFFLEGDSYDLDGNYTLTKSVMLTSDATDKATIKGGEFQFSTAINSFKLSNIIFDGGEDGNLLEATDAAASLNELSIEGCEINNIKGQVIYDNKGGTWGSIVINNTIVNNVAYGGDGILDIRSGALTSCTITNSTFANGFRSFLRVEVETTVSLTNCTVYMACAEEDGSNRGLFSMAKGKSLTVKNCLFHSVGLNCSAVDNVKSGVWGRTDKLKVSEAVYENNYYYSCPNLWGGIYSDNHANVATEADPQFKDATNGDFTVQNQTLIDAQVGDPRWLQ